MEKIMMIKYMKMLEASSLLTRIGYKQSLCISISVSGSKYKPIKLDGVKCFLI